MTEWETVLEYWFDELDPDRWFARDADVDAEISRRFGRLRARLATGVPENWRVTARGVLAAIVVLDQFGRNLFRDDPRAFACDPVARALALDAIESGFDTRLAPAERQFLYMPLMHSERLADVERCAGLMDTADLDDAAQYARRHLEVIRRFGRYPARNAALGRTTTAAEAAFLAEAPEGF